jgi:hypothetical protein
MKEIILTNWQLITKIHELEKELGKERNQIDWDKVFCYLCGRKGQSEANNIFRDSPHPNNRFYLFYNIETNEIEVEENLIRDAKKPIVCKKLCLKLWGNTLNKQSDKLKKLGWQ